MLHASATTSRTEPSPIIHYYLPSQGSADSRKADGAGISAQNESAEDIEPQRMIKFGRIFFKGRVAKFAIAIPAAKACIHRKDEA